LGGIERAGFGVSEEAVEGVGNVEEVEGDGGEVARTGDELILAEGAAPAVEIFMSKLEGVENGARDGGDVGVSAAEPRFGGGYCAGG
jgi:hypothetical protein